MSRVKVSRHRQTTLSGNIAFDLKTGDIIVLLRFEPTLFYTMIYQPDQL